MSDKAILKQFIAELCGDLGNLQTILEASANSEPWAAESLQTEIVSRHVGNRLKFLADEARAILSESAEADRLEARAANVIPQFATTRNLDALALSFARSKARREAPDPGELPFLRYVGS